MAAGSVPWKRSNTPWHNSEAAPEEFIPEILDHTRAVITLKLNSFLCLPVSNTPEFPFHSLWDFSLCVRVCMPWIVCFYIIFQVSSDFPDTEDNTSVILALRWDTVKWPTWGRNFWDIIEGEQAIIFLVYCYISTTIHVGGYSGFSVCVTRILVSVCEHGFLEWCLVVDQWFEKAWLDAAQENLHLLLLVLWERKLWA